MAATATEGGGAMDCRPGCGACCIAPSIASPLPGMPGGKPAGVPCAHLTPDYRCELFGRPERPAFCGSLRPSREMCGEDRQAALAWLAWLETTTHPAQPADQVPQKVRNSAMNSPDAGSA